MMSIEHQNPEFLWGVATSAFQIEGAADEEGRTASIWDDFCRKPGKIAEGDTGAHACDHFHRYPEDIALMRTLGVNAYRFSVSWPRIFPSRQGALAERGISFYNRIIDRLLEAGIMPVLTLYHWDLPSYLDHSGGWTDRDTAFRFRDYAAECYRRFGDRVGKFITLNEPYCSAILGYLTGVHAPGSRDASMAYSAIHHLNLAHGLAVQAFHQSGSSAEIGIALNLKTAVPVNNHEENLIATDRALDRDCRMFIDPLFGRPYPSRHLEAHPEIRMPVLPGDERIIAQPIDFIGLNYYSERSVEYDPEAAEQFRIVENPWRPKTGMGWDIVPEGLYRHIAWVHENYPLTDLYVMENGCAFPDSLSNGGTRCHDPLRIRYLDHHIHECHRARENGLPVKGYFVWSLLDNFEWNYGYSKRFGLVYCEYETGKRIPKSSYYFYRDVIAGTYSHRERSSWSL